MSNIAFIPVRGGSKSIHMKNIKPIAGRPLVWWTAIAASECTEIDIVYVATDNDEIRDTVNRLQIPKVKVIARSNESATDTASTETAMLEFAEKYDFQNIVLIQATSPLLTSNDISGGFAAFRKEGIDSVLSVVRQNRFVWKETGKGTVCPVNYEVLKRPRRQEFDGYLVENGAFYITSRRKLMETNCRISGNIGFYEMPPETYYEIDEPMDWQIIEQLLIRRRNMEQKKRGFDLKMFLTDCDGCLTDGGMYYSENGDELKKFNTKDGYAFQMLRERGVITGIITGEERRLNQRRADKLYIDEIIQRAKDKKEVVKNLCEKYSIIPSQVVYVGDDIMDVEAMRYVGISYAPADAVREAREAADIVTKAKGGDGVIREIVDLYC